jgi:NADH-quinone oxidoreductase subunit F
VAPLSLHRVLPAEPYSTLDDWVAEGGGQGLATAVELAPGDIVEIVEASGLRGRGGAGFPTGVKWRSVVAASGADAPAHLVCNAAEGEPATAKDRTLLARNPFAVIEGVAIAMRAVGADGAYVGVKRRFTHEVDRLLDARDAAAAAGWPGAERIRIVPGPDEYLFGEESAMLEVIEGKLPLPRILPPYQAGLFATMEHPNPTVVNNVETLAHVAHVLREGADWFRQVGTTEAPGTMVFTVVGDVARPGVYELPLGTSARELIVDLAGADDVLAIYAGTSNGVITRELLDLPLDFDSFAEAGTGLGSGGFAVYDTSRDIVQVCAALARFLAIESCGQCLACKLGTAEIFDRLDALVRGDGTLADIDEIRRRTDTVTDQNRCYLPVGAALVVRSTIDTFPDAFATHVGRSSDPAVAVPVPKISVLDAATSEMTFDPDYHRKRSDWSYAD